MADPNMKAVSQDAGTAFLLLSAGRSDCLGVNGMRIAIVGAGGAGLTTAWLLEEAHAVTVFEKEARWGGHADTYQVEVDGQRAALDGGFEFVSAEMFPTFLRLLRHLRVPLLRYPMSVTFYAAGRRTTTVLPPQRQGKVRWASFTPGGLLTLLQFRHVLRRVRSVMEARDTQTTLAQFVEGLYLTRSFKEAFFYPFLSAGWGVEPGAFRDFIAYNALRYAYLHQPAGLRPFYWWDIVGGAQTYIQALMGELTHTTLRPAGEIVRLNRTPAGDYAVTDHQGNAWTFDHVVLATDALTAGRLLAGVEEAAPVQAALARQTYFPTHIAIHGDTRLMPPDRRDWSVVNIHYDGRHAATTVWKTWRAPHRPVFKSWVTFATTLPAPLYAQATYWHPAINAAHFASQKVVQAHQGRHNLWLAGMYTHDVDCHESAILSAVNVAQRLAPNGTRLRQLMG